MKNVGDSKFQVQVAYTDLKSNELSQLPNFYQYLQKKQIHAFKLQVKMEKAGEASTVAEGGASAAQQDEIFASAA